MGKPLTALNFFRLAEKEMPNRWEISKHMGLAYLSFGRFDKAVELLVNSLNINTGDFIFKPEKRNDADTWDKIGYCFFQLGKYFEAKTSWERAVEIGTDEIQIKLNKKRIDMLEKEWGI
jgi:tetratricopeptide (TPR) repeat protein